MKPLAAALCLLLSATIAAADAPPTFTKKPTATKSGDGLKIEFAVDRATDVAIYIEDGEGKVLLEGRKRKHIRTHQELGRLIGPAGQLYAAFKPTAADFPSERGAHRSFAGDGAHEIDFLRSQNPERLDENAEPFLLVQAPEARDHDRLVG